MHDRLPVRVKWIAFTGPRLQLPYTWCRLLLSTQHSLRLLPQAEPYADVVRRAICICSASKHGGCIVRAQNIDHKEIGTPKTHKKFLGRYDGSYGPIPSKKLLGLLPMPFNSTKIQNLYCVGDSCFPGQGLNAVAFSGYACAHKIGAKLNINSFKLPD